MLQVNHSAPGIIVGCPHCERRLRVYGDQVARRHRCPECDVVLTLQLLKIGAPRPDQPHASDQDAEQKREMEQEEVGGASLNSDELQATLAESQARPPHWLLRLEWPFTHLSLPAQRRILYSILHFGGGIAVIFIGLLFASGQVGAAGLLWLLAGYYPSQIIAGLLLPKLAKTFRCPGCGFEMDAVGIWSAGGYTDHVERHILNFRNPINDAVIGHLDCPQCDSTILIR